MLQVQNITYLHPDREPLFTNLNFSLQTHDKVALVGANGSGKSTLLKLIAGELYPQEGNIHCQARRYYIPQHFGQFDNLTIGEALQIDHKLKALDQLTNGNYEEKYLSVLNNDWMIETRIQDALAFWHLPDISVNFPVAKLSGGEKTRIFLAGIQIHEPDLVLFDEPTNHLDLKGREQLYEYVLSCSQTLMVVTHDRTLLQLLNPIWELDKTGLNCYGGNYEFYLEQKTAAGQARIQHLHERKTALKKAQKIEREALERKNRQDARGRRQQVKAGTPKSMMRKMKNNAESSSSQLKDIHAKKVAGIQNDIHQARLDLPDIARMKLNFENSNLHRGKVLAKARDINFSYQSQRLWTTPLSFQFFSGERIHIKGNNGSGKTTLIKLLLGKLRPDAGDLYTADFSSVYIDQDYSIIHNDYSLWEQAQHFNVKHLPDYEIGIRLNRYLFDHESWNKSCRTLSGGEKLRLILCCMMIGNQAPDLFILDEPTNNLDLENIEILTQAVNDYHGTVLVVSHDRYFLNEINVSRTIELI